MNTDLVREFVVFARHLSFTSAARELGMSQPTLSRHVGELERHFGCELVDRAADPLKLTYCGRELLEKAAGLLACEDALEESMRRAGREPRARLVVERYRKSPMIHGLLSNAIDELGRRHPGFSVVRKALRPGAALDDAVLRGEVDVGIVACTTDGEPSCPVGEREGFGVLGLTGYPERIRFALPTDNPLSGSPALSLSDLAQCCFVFPLNPEFGRCQPDVAALLAARGLKLRWRPYELNDVEELGLMRLEPDDVFIVVEGAARTPETYYLQNPNLAIVPCSDDIRVWRYLVWRKDDNNPALRAYLDVIKEMQGRAGDRP